MISAMIVFTILRRLTMSFERWPAFILGVIDKDGNTLIKRKDMTKVQADSFTMLHVLIRNLKKFMNTIPGLNTKIGTYAAALWLLKEAQNINNIDQKQLNEMMSDTSLETLYLAIERVISVNPDMDDSGFIDLLVSENIVNTTSAVDFARTLVKVHLKTDKWDIWSQNIDEVEDEDYEEEKQQLKKALEDHDNR